MTVYLPSLSYINMGVLGYQYCQPEPFKHANRYVGETPYIAELADELPAHAARAGRRRNVGGDCDGAEVACFSSLVVGYLAYRLFKSIFYVSTYVLRHSIADRDSLCAGSNRIRGILDVGASDDGAAGQEQSAADVEVGVWAFRITG